MTLRLRFAIAAGIILVVLAAAGLLVPRVAMSSEIGQVDQRLIGAVPPALKFVGFSGPTRPPRAPRLEPRFSPRFSNVYVATVDSSGRHVVISSDPSSGAPALPRVLSRLGSGRPVVATVPSLDGTGRWRATLLSRRVGPEVLVAISLQTVDATDALLHWVLLCAGAVVAVVLGALWWWIVRLGLNPITEITEVADAIAAGDRSRRARDRSSDDEAAHLARAFNVMLDEEQAREERLQRFVADASHELRTPVTVIEGVADLWRHGALRADGALDDALGRVGEESARMAALVSDLLEVARLDESTAIARDDVDLSALARDARAEVAARVADHPISAEVADTVRTVGDAPRLRQVVVNLLANACVHTPPGTKVHLRVAERDGSCVLEVADDGPGMSAEDAARAFDRFWRKDPARGGSGTGLGLPIVAGIVAAHGGTVALTTAPGVGLEVCVRLPRSSGSAARTVPGPEDGPQPRSRARAARVGRARRRGTAGVVADSGGATASSG